MNWDAFRAFIGDFFAFGRRRALLACILVAAGGLVEGFGLILIIPLLDVVGGGGTAAPTARTALTLRILHSLGADDRLHRIGVVLAVFAVAMIARSLLLAWRQVAITSLQLDYLTAQQTGLIRTLGAAPWTRVSRLRHSRITHLLSNDVFRVGQAATGLLQSIVSIIMLAIQFVIAMLLDPLLTLIALGLLVVTGVMGASLVRAARNLGDLVIGSNLMLLNDAGQFLGALKLAVSQNLQPQFVADFSATLITVAGEELGYVRRQNRIRLRLTIVAVIVGAGTAFVGFGVLQMPAATLIALLLVLSRMSGPTALLQGQALEMVRSLPAYSHLRALEAELTGDAASRTALPTPPFGDIAFEHVAYQHDGGSSSARGLRDFSMTIAAGSFVGIAGPSGAGKTTFADLLVGLCEPQAGSITVGGAPVTLPLMAAWRDQLAYVSQDAFLKHDSVRENLLWGAPDADDAAITRALAVSGADAVVARLPDGIDTIVGERGTLISGGERQRLAIARALLRAPRLLILDEATNAIDVASERSLLERLDQLRPAMTIVMIAHRLESLQLCDPVVIVEAGCVVDQGNFTSLKARLADSGLRGIDGGGGGGDGDRPDWDDS